MDGAGGVKLIYKKSIVERMDNALHDAFLRDRRVEAIELTEAEWREYRRYVTDLALNYNNGDRKPFDGGCYFRGIRVRLEVA